MLKLMMITITLIPMMFLINKNIYPAMLKNSLFLMLMILLPMMNKTINFSVNIFLSLGLDTISTSLIILTIWILGLCMIASLNTIKKNFMKNFMILMVVLMIALIISFSALNMMIFYIFFELSLIPIMLLIMGWGNQVNRIQATMYMILYTLFGSLPLLIMITLVFNKFDSSMMIIQSMFSMKFNVNNLFFYTIMMSAFLIKMPMYFVHLWLPKAHVEAPISGSMILAGIMLKLGSYGIYRFMVMTPQLFMHFNIYIMMISLMGSIYASLICLTQTDMKIIVAYSSVVHMGILMASMMTLSSWSYTGSIMMMIAHGLCSSGMFCLVNFNYERTHSRSLLMNKGMLMILPSLSLWWFLLCTSNFSAPPSLNLFSEMMLFNSLILWDNLTITLLFIVSLISTSYSVYLYSFTQYGKLFKGMFNFSMVSVREMLLMILHWGPLNMMFIYLNFLI